MRCEVSRVWNKHFGLKGTPQSAGQSHFGSGAKTVEVLSRALLSRGGQVLGNPVPTWRLRWWIGRATVFQLIDIAIDIAILEVGLAFGPMFASFVFGKGVVRQSVETFSKNVVVGSEQRFVNKGAVGIMYEAAS